MIGLGAMGSRVAMALSGSGWPVAVWDNVRHVLARAGELGADPCRSVAEVAAQSAVVLISLPGPEEVREVVAGDEGLLRAAQPPRYIVDLSTVDPATTRHLSGLAIEVGTGYLDAPVLGRPLACGKWTLPVGGRPEDLKEVMEPLMCLATKVVRVGPPGAGNTVKLMNNLMFGAINAITAECMAGVERVGLDPELFFRTVVESDAATVSRLFREIGPKILAQDWFPTFTLSLLEKDNRLAVELLASVGVEAVVGRAVDELNRRGLAAGLGPDDTCGLVRLMRCSAWEDGEVL